MDILGILWNTIIYNPMLNAMLLIYSFIPNYGVAIILFTLVVAFATMPLRIASQNSMKKMQEKQARLKPKLDELKKKYKDQPQQLQQAQMKLYQEEGGLNPINAGCLLTLLPFPIFIGMYNVISSVMGDRPESMMALSQHIYTTALNLAQLIPVNNMFFGLNLALAPSAISPVIGVLMAGLVAGTSYLQTRMMSNPSAAMDPQQAQMNQSMQLMMPLIFAFFVWSAPTGLSLYWITFSVVGIIQQVIMTGPQSLTNLLPKAAPPPAPRRPRLAADESKEKGTVASETAVTTTAPSNGSEKQPLTADQGAPKKKGKKKR